MGARVRRALARLRAFVQPGALDRDFSEELESHLAMLIDDNLRRGMTREEARRAAVVRLGNPASLRARHRDVAGLPHAERLLQDLRFALRLVRKDPWFSATAVVTLAIGIGINALGFSIVNAAFLRGLPFARADRLSVVAWRPTEGRRQSLSYPELQDFRARSQTFTGLSAYLNGPVNLGDDMSQPERVRATWLTADAFELLGEQPVAGRGFATDDLREGSERIAIISSGLWRTRYGADPAVLGRAIRVNGDTATIVGVMGAGFAFPDNTDLWMPFVPTARQRQRDARVLLAFGRLRDGVDRAAAQAEMDDIAKQLIDAHPEVSRDLAGARVDTFTEAFVGGQARVMFLALMGAVCFVLLIACVNVANLLLARSVYRRREMALRAALGAGRGRLLRQLLVESAVLGVLGGALGLVLTTAGVRAFAAAIRDPGKPFWIVFDVDYVVFAYVAAVCVLTAVASGLAPALLTSRTRGGAVLDDDSRGSTASPRTRRLSGALIVTELALTVVLLVGAGLMIRSLFNVSRLDVGIRTDGLTLMPIRLLGPKYATADARRAFYDRLESRLAALAGVEAAALTTAVPPFDGGERLIEVEGKAPSGRRFVSIASVGDSFFAAVDVHTLRGRSFDAVPANASAGIVVVNDLLASRFFPGEDPVARRIRLRRPGAAADGASEPWLTIVGVTSTIRQGSIRDRTPNPVAYLPYRQSPPQEAFLLARSRLSPAVVLSEVRREAQSIDRDQPVPSIQTVREMIDESTWHFHAFGNAFGILGLMALILSSVGVYGVGAYAASQRASEIGIRMALGSTGRQVLWLILRRGMRQLAWGLTIGVAAAFAVSRVLSGMLVGLGPADPVTFVSIAALLALVSTAACVVPARRASRIDPVDAIRQP